MTKETFEVYIHLISFFNLYSAFSFFFQFIVLHLTLPIMDKSKGQGEVMTVSTESCTCLTVTLGLAKPQSDGLFQHQKCCGLVQEREAVPYTSTSALLPRWLLLYSNADLLSLI